MIRMNPGFLHHLLLVHWEIHSCRGFLRHPLLEGHLGSHSYLLHHLTLVQLLSNCFLLEQILPSVIEVRKLRALHFVLGKGLLNLHR